MKMFKSLLKSKTIWFSVMLAALGAVEVNSQIIPEEFRGYVLVLIAGVSVVLRFLTTQPVGAK